MKKIATISITALLALGAVTQATAQYQKPIGLSVRLGVFYPTNGDARNVEGQGWFGGGLEYKIKDLKFDTTDSRYSSTLTASLDYYGKGSFSQVPLLVNYVAHMDSFYWTGGAGIGFGRVPTTGGSTSDTEFAYQMGIGYDFVKSQMPFFVELKYFGSTESKLNGFGVYGGVRF